VQPAWLSETLAGLAVASGVGYLAAAYSVSRWLTRPSPGRARKTPADHGLPWEPLECRTADGFRLVGWAVTPARPRGTVVLFHGIRGNREKTLGRTAFLAAAGYRCVAFDHRAHGESTGRRTSFGFHESRDVRAILELVRERWPGQRLAVLGISMGAAALCYAADVSRRCDAVILESLYHDIAGAFISRIGNGYPPWFRRLSRGAVWVTERRLGLRLAQLAPVRHVGDLAPAPVLLLTGSDDPHASPADVRRLHDHCRGPRELWLVPRAGHEDVCEAGGADYQRRILDFLGRHLS
jgi:alpha-beta hydrolase superfamily lysophospholipase